MPDPSPFASADARESARQLVRATRCPFADIDRVAFFYSGDALAAWCRRLDEFMRREIAHAPELDGVIATMPASAEVTSTARLGALLRTVLETVGDTPLGDPESPDWWFSYRSQDWVVLAFSPVYPADHPRTTRGDPYLHLFFQSERAFDRFRGADGRIAMQARRRVRARFAERGQRYSDAIAEHPLEAAKFVLPMAAEAPPVRWWR